MTLALLALLLVTIAVLVWRAVTRDRRDYARFKRLRSTTLRRKVFARWLIESWVVLGGLAAALLLAASPLVGDALRDTRGWEILAQVPWDTAVAGWVLAGFCAALFALVIFIFRPQSATLVLVFAACYGGFAYTLYSIAVAHANDHANPEDFVKVSGGLLMLYGFGTMIGPLLGAALMGLLPEGLFLATAVAHLGLAAYTLLRIRARAPVPIEDREAFKTQPAERALTPEAARLDPRTQTEGS